MEGFLDKKGRGKTCPFLRPWSNRFFSIDLDTNELKYFALDISLKGSVDVTGSTVVDVAEGEKPHMFELHMTDGEVFILSAPTSKDKTKWIACLTRMSVVDSHAHTLLNTSSKTDVDAKSTLLMKLKQQERA